MLYGKRDELDKVGSFNIMYGAIHIEQNHTLAYVGCSLDEIFSNELLPDINKTISNLDFHIRKMKFLFEPLRRLHCNALIQPQLCVLVLVPLLKQQIKVKLTNTTK